MESKNKLMVAGVVVSLLSIMLTGYGKYNGNSKTKNFVVTNVVDGDTIDIDSGTRVRLYAINSVEYPNGCLSTEAKKRMEELVLNKKVTMIEKGKDNFGRTLALIYVKDLSINKAMVAEGLAVYEGNQNPDDTNLLDIEKSNSEAKVAKRGVWSSRCSQPNPKCVIKGNFRESNNTKIYTLPNCYNYEKIIVDPTGRDKWFCSEKEAIVAGFVKSKDCPGMK